ncbi:NAD(P)H-binding protein [Streptomyces ipomoeae]|uniref:NAD(P)H-binding protein n=1 Tax=Streptomyces ipomoeae TaxID=103232 RepID=UPI0011477C7A|nr:NAD(P)H-binding protein [Streptomyces ipomoeae]TQE24407.1 SDR family NAD(P)-dependent oxidoreductase [Streptomyces ipomoeae]
MNDTPVLVLGGTGKTGRRVARQLTERGRTARVAARSGPQRFDWWDKETWADAVEGVEAVYVVDEQGAWAAELLADFTSFATRRGVRRLVYLSARTLEQWAHDEERFTAERVVRESGVGWTILRPTWFAQNFSEDRLLFPDVAAGEVVLPDGQGVEPFVDAEDIAAVAVAALTEDGHEGELYGLSGPRLMTFVECVELIAEASGRKVRPVVVSREEYAGHLVRRGYARDFADFMNEIFDTIRDGATAYLSDGVRRALGRAPRDFAEYVAETDWDAVSAR